jgi:hypothetical protein
MLDASVSNPEIPKCHTALLFLTDGEADSPMSVINSRNTAFKAIIFAYTLGSGASKSVPLQTACETKGLYTHVEDGGDLRSQMAGYYKYFALDVSGTRKSIWSEFYQDFSLNITMTTSASPCFDKNGELLGVSGVDVLKSDLLEIHNNVLEIENELKSRSAGCPDFQQTEAVLNSLRGGACNYCTGCSNSPGKLFGSIVLIFISLILSIC